MSGTSDRSNGGETQRLIDKLRDTLPTLLPTVYRAMLDVALQFMDHLLKLKVGPKEKRVWCFGPYREGGRERIEKIARKVAEFGYAPITGFGFMRANEPYKIHPLTDIMPSSVQELQKAIPGHIFFYEIPRLASKAIIDMTIQRGQHDELRGCFDHKIPALGYVV
jgi:hypothetical protein